MAGAARPDASILTKLMISLIFDHINGERAV